MFAEFKQLFEAHMFAWQKKNLSYSQLDQAICYSMNTQAKRLRPLIVWMLAKDCKTCLDVALSVECLHTASLIADDLPCMDDALYRRGNEALHRAFGEDVAILATYKLIGWAFKFVATQSKTQKLSAHETQLVLDCVATNCILSTDGQMLDLISEESGLKTHPLFEMAFVLGWIFSRGSIEMIETVKLAAFHFGTAFQIHDDLKDMDEDKKNNKPNVALTLGEFGAKNALDEHLETLRSLLQELDCLSSDFLTCIKHLHSPAQPLRL
ncbi:MAG: Geranylgeranyl diphosphate synthase [Chlamydiae bacterium]|nr:Geranylgeranyl diphosphate synthase [Chlamydiota bacterium]